MSRPRPDVCRFCGCASDSCRLPEGGGELCAWLTADRTVCTAPSCAYAFYSSCQRAEGKRRKATRKRTPGEIHQLMIDERRQRRRAARARKKGHAA